MYTDQYAVIQHLTAGKTDNFSEVKTIKAYAGELKDAVKLTQMLPAALVFTNDSLPLRETAEFNNDIIIITKSDSFDMQTNAANNMQLAEKIVNYLGKNYSWTYSSLPWTLDTEQVSVRTAAIDNKFAIVVVRLVLKNLE